MIFTEPTRTRRKVGHTTLDHTTLEHSPDQPVGHPAPLKSALPEPDLSEPGLSEPSLSEDETAMCPFYVWGGQQRSPRSALNHKQQWYDYQKGIVLHVEPRSGTIETCLEYVSPQDVCAPGDPILFKSGVVQDGMLYVCTETEVLVYELPAFNCVSHISLPCFNDVHHVRPLPDGTLLVAISGLDMVVEVDQAGNVIREWDVLNRRNWNHYCKEMDYRQGISTKPHKSHPNYLADANGEIWVTRFEQKDAICLTNPERRIDIGIERVHDGYFYQGYLYFTTVNGMVVIANPNTLQVEEVVDLTQFHDPDDVLGWCRGILVRGTKAWIGFSRIRPTKFREALSWLRQGFKTSRETHVACYDLAAKKCVMEIEVESHNLNAVFSICSAFA